MPTCAQSAPVGLKLPYGSTSRFSTNVGGRITGHHPIVRAGPSTLKALSS
jgi:hypothetical protein